MYLFGGPPAPTRTTTTKIPYRTSTHFIWILLILLNSGLNQVLISYSVSHLYSEYSRTLAQVQCHLYFVSADNWLYIITLNIPFRNVQPALGFMSPQISTPCSEWAFGFECHNCPIGVCYFPLDIIMYYPFASIQFNLYCYIVDLFGIYIIGPRHYTSDMMVCSMYISLPILFF